MKPTVIHENNRFLPAIIKVNGKIKKLPGAFYGEPAALAAAQRKIDRLKDAKLKKKAKKTHPLILVNKNKIEDRYIVCVEIEAVVYSLDSSGEWVKWSEYLMHLQFTSYQQAYQAGLDFLEAKKNA